MRAVNLYFTHHIVAFEYIERYDHAGETVALVFFIGIHELIIHKK